MKAPAVVLYGPVTAALLVVSLLAFPSIAGAAERVVIMEEFSATW